MLLFKFLIVLIAFKNILAGSNRTGGNTVAPKVHTAKFAAGIQLLYPKDEHLCGGVMINLMHVLTAATCVQGFEEGWNLAQLKLKTSDQSQENRASTFFIHDSFNRETGENNLAVIKVGMDEVISKPVLQGIMWK
ncbi:unnamed protein product [Hermetia illucens]|uniref:Peptidase S1 domain-containing protein n=1 Tax=Hermetia illucens TaxID=343691 RepID=A0A7R8UPE6_HERIL|nr:unnamed protein product [Hermetia illucens]